NLAGMYCTPPPNLSNGHGGVAVRLDEVRRRPICVSARRRPDEISEHHGDRRRTGSGMCVNVSIQRIRWRELRRIGSHPAAANRGKWLNIGRRSSPFLSPPKRSHLNKRHTGFLLT